MKKRLRIFLTAVLMLYVSARMVTAETEIRLEEISSESTIRTDETVLVISGDHFSSETEYDAFLKNQGIIVVLQDGGKNLSQRI